MGGGLSLQAGMPLQVYLFRIPDERIRLILTRFRPEMVDCGPDQGRSEFETTGVAALRRGFQRRENTALGRKMPFLDGH